MKNFPVATIMTDTSLQQKCGSGETITKTNGKNRSYPHSQLIMQTLPVFLNKLNNGSGQNGMSSSISEKFGAGRAA